MTTLKEITQLSTGLLPQREWALNRWYYADPLRYYYKKGSSLFVTQDPRFYQHVDSCLKDLCQLLHALDIKTSPSCEGHFHPYEWFHDVWKKMNEESLLIKTDGLLVRDSETEEAFLFHDPQYKLPWTSSDEFFTASQEVQNIGYIGFLIPYWMSELSFDLKKLSADTLSYFFACDSELSHALKGHYFHLYVKSKSASETVYTWNLWTHKITRVLYQNFSRCDFSSHPLNEGPGRVEHGQKRQYLFEQKPSAPQTHEQTHDQGVEFAKAPYRRFRKQLP